MDIEGKKTPCQTHENHISFVCKGPGALGGPTGESRGPKEAPTAPRWPTSGLGRPTWPQRAPRPQDGPRWPKSQDGPKVVPSRPQGNPRRAHGVPKMAQEAPEITPMGAREGPEDGPTRAQDQVKIAQHLATYSKLEARRPKAQNIDKQLQINVSDRFGGPRGPKRRVQGVRGGPKSGQDGP